MRWKNSKHLDGSWGSSKRMQSGHILVVVDNCNLYIHSGNGYSICIFNPNGTYLFQAHTRSNSTKAKMELVAKYKELTCVNS